MGWRHTGWYLTPLGDLAGHKRDWRGGRLIGSVPRVEMVDLVVHFSRL